MSKWRPVPLNCLYTISDVHGQLQQLELIFSRILPLRCSDGGQDHLVMLGDYVDRHTDSHKVIDLLISIKKKYNSQITLLRGNHEQMMLEGLAASNNSDKYLYWMKNGGEQTLAGYLERAGQPMANPYLLLRSRAADFVPKEHINFFQNQLVNSFEMNGFFFCHAGFNQEREFRNQLIDDLIWDAAGSYKLAKKGSIVTDLTVITGHYRDGPFISNNYMMLDASNKKELLIVELNSMECFTARAGHGKLVKFPLEISPTK